MTKFRVTYDGSALASHEMDVRELSPALLAMADLLDASVRALHGDKAKAQINVRGSFKTGSFNIDFTTQVAFLKAVRDIFAGDNATAIANALAILSALGFLGNKGVAQVLKWLRGRKITTVQPLEDGSARIFVDEDSMDVEVTVIALLRDLNVRQSFNRVLAPLDREGIDRFAVGDDKGVELVITEDERAYFAPPAGQDILLIEETRRMAFSIVALAFKDDNKWRLSDGNATINAAISDSEFLGRVNSSEESFSKGDVLICEVRVQQWQSESGAKTDYEVTRVLEHRRAAMQIPIPGIDSV
ncbi:hypothetical protein [Xanthomonas citri]|uniref:hypothetical protein n=1 Tax=Xanthomonas citri TaxID=346 RepID=UPI0018DF638B|nr:hypothetical protein [Xanthomonas citri]